MPRDLLPGDVVRRPIMFSFPDEIFIILKVVDGGYKLPILTVLEPDGSLREWGGAPFELVVGE